jgi:DNA-binding response OmpR family regulator
MSLLVKRTTCFIKNDGEPDDDAIRWALREALEQEGYTVSEAPDGQLALDQLLVSPHELVVLLDVMMPGMDGLTLLQRIAAEASVVKRHVYIVMTARRQTFPAPAVQVFQQLGVHVIQKPFELDTLVAAVEQAASGLS